MSKPSRLSTFRTAIRKVFNRVAQDGSESKVEPGYFIDLVVFILALNAYVQLKGEEDPHVDEATRLLRRYQPEVVEGVEKFLQPLAAKGGAYARFRTGVGIAARPTRGVAQAQTQARVLADMFTVLRTHHDDLKATFSDNRAAGTAQKVANLASSESPETVLNGLATVPPASRLRMTREWVKDAAKLAGVAPSDIEAVLADAEAAKNIGDDIRAVEAKLNIVDPVSADAADLQEQKQELLSRLDSVVETSENPTVVLSAAASAAAQDKVYATKVGKAQRLSADQERAMLVRGKGIIAAGAGSGKTKTLASKVVYHLDELGVPPRAIMATSFSRKSAAELRKRIEDYGANFGNGEDTGLGTTHSIAAKLMREYSNGGRDGVKPYEQTNLVRLAMQQVEMPSNGKPPPSPTSLLSAPAVVPVAAPARPTTTPAPGMGGRGLTFAQAVEQAYRASGGFPKSGYGDFARGMIADFYGKTQRGGVDPRNLSEKQVGALGQIFNMARVTYRLDTDPSLASSGARFAAKKPRDKDKGLREKYTSFSQPMNQWFNLGLHLTDDGTSKGEPLPPGQFKQAITKFKGRMISPSEAYSLALADELPDELGVPEAAVYAAYEHLKGPNGEVDFANKGDFDDVLIDVSKMLLSNPRALSSAQARFKVILVDEAQDLNRAQHMMFGLIAGFIDPAKANKVATVKKIGELAKDDGTMTADTYCFIGDDKQCVAADSPVNTPNGVVLARDLKAGDTVLSYRNGRVTPQTVKHALPTSWEWGFKVTTEGGHTLTMSPNHRLWATEPQTSEDELLVYLMYRSDMGFRVGITNKGKVGSEGDYLNSYGGRAFLEKAERMWVLEVCPDRESALLAEARYMLQYGVPDTVFNGEHRGVNQERVDALFKEFGQNGAKVLEAKHYGFHYPHWASQSYTKHGRERHVVTLLAHASTGTQVSMEWEGPKFDVLTAGMGVKHAPDERRRLRRYFANYREALAFAGKVSEVTGAMLSHKLSTDEGSLREVTAAGLFAGMSVPVLTEDGVVLDPIVCIQRAEGSFIDLDVDDASNFFAGDILTHNSIYEFRGADPEAFIDMSDLVEGGAGFKTEILKTNYRSGELIVEAANRLISYNKKQIPMTCAANPSRSDKGGISRIPFAPQDRNDPQSLQAPAKWLAERVEEMMELGEGGKKGYDAFGVGLRSNAEAYTYGVELLKKGIPFRAKANFFGDTNTKALLNWLTVADEGMDGDVARLNDAVLNARTAPTSMLGQKFVDELTQRATGNYLVWLQQNYASIYGPRGFQTASVKAYVDNLTTVANLKNSGLSNEQLLDTILALQGSDGGTVKDALIDKVRDDDEIMAELRAADPKGEVLDEAVQEQAMAPIEPLKGLLDARANVTEAMNYVRTLQAANAKLSANDDPEAKGFKEPAVTLGTMHSWKGLEVENMFVPVVGGKFPRTDATDEELASERRLAYVALTRGENKVFVMDIPTVRRTREGEVILTSQFIEELCLPTQVTAKTSSTRSRFAGMADDPMLLDAFVQGEAAFERAVSMGGSSMPAPLWNDPLYTGE